MLTYKINKLLNLVLRLETAMSETLTDEREDATISEQSDYKKENDAFNVIDRNIQSIKKTLKRL